MKLKSMTASFGRLQNARLDLEPGLNLIQAPNEGGKSTWCAFLRAMLYGIPTRERDRQGYLAEKNRYQPWSGGPLEGAVTLTWQGRDIILRRGAKGTAPFGAFSATDAVTGAPISGLTAENCGEMLLGVSRGVYERSAFVGQGGAAVGADAELEKRIAALVSSGEEDVSYSQVEAKLREWLRRRKFNKSGLIPKLENELEVLDDALRHQERAQNQAEDAKREIAALSARAEELAAALAAYRRKISQAQYQKAMAARTALEAAQAEVAALAASAARIPDGETLRGAQGDLAYLRTVEANLKLATRQAGEAAAVAAAERAKVADPLFPDKTADEAWQKACADAAQVTASMGRPARGTRLWGVLMLILAAAAVAGGLLGPWPGRELALLPGAVLAAGGVAVLLRAALAQKKRTDEASAILARYGATYPQDIMEKANGYRERCVVAAEAVQKAQAVVTEQGRLEAEREEITRRLLGLARTFEPNVTDSFGVSAALSKALNLRERLATAQVRMEGAEALFESLGAAAELGQNPAANAGEETALPEMTSPGETAAALAAAEGELARQKNSLAMASGELNTLGDPVVFRAKREAVQEELAARQEEYNALTAALEALSAANSDLQARFSPALNGAAGAILAELTGGRYAAVSLNRQFEATAQEADSPLPRQAAALSQGTAEQLYLAVRLAVCGLALPGDDPAPLVLDDALDTFDDTRMGLALDYLQGAAEKRQILLFSCHSREGTYLAQKGGSHVVCLQL